MSTPSITVTESETLVQVQVNLGATGPQGPEGPTGPAGSDASVTEANIISALGYTPADDADLAGKKADSMATNKLLGRGTAGTGAIEEITLGTNLSLSGTTLNATGGGGGGTWGSITGTLSNQTDLNSALAGKQQTLTNYSSIAALTGYPLSFNPSSHTHSPSDITGTAVITSDARLSDERVPTSAGIASKTNGASAATPNDSDLIPIAESSSSLKKLSLTNLWTWITTKIGAITSITAGGAWSFTSTTRPTSSGTGTPASDSLITKADGDARFAPQFYAYDTGTSQLTIVGTDFVPILTSEQLPAGKYRVQAFCHLVGNSSLGGSKIRINSSATIGNGNGEFGTKVSASTFQRAQNVAGLSTASLVTGTGAGVAPVSYDLLVILTTAGTISLEAAQNTAEGTGLTIRSQTSLFIQAFSKP